MSEDRKFGQRKGEISGPCEEWQSLRSLAAAGEELDPAEDSRLAQHLSACEACSADLAREKETLALLSSQYFEPDAALLASCRAGLQDALDREEDRGWIARSLGVLLPSSWISPRPAWSAAILLLIGFCVGLFGPRLLLRDSAVHEPSASSASPASEGYPSAPAVASQPQVLVAQNSPTVAANGASAPSSSAPSSSAPSSPAPGSALTALDLHRATVASINLLPSGAGIPQQVQLQMEAPQPFTMQGTVDDGNVRDVLLYVLRHGDLFPPNVRMGAVNALSPRSQDPDVHSALSRAFRQDASPAVRVSALQALNAKQPQDLVGRMLLDALSGDQDPSVREQAMDTLRSLADVGQLSADDHMLSALRDHMRNDSDPYIRAQSAAVVRELVSQQSGNQ
jgi:anti-sigma factor RsiW